MSNAAIYLHPNGFDTTGSQLLGRHSAGESFLRGFLRHADVDQFHFWNVAHRPQAELDALVGRIGELTRPVNWIAPRNRPGLGAAGVLNMPGPDIGGEAWHRRPTGSRAYSICGITHTTATANVMRLLPDLLIAPTEDFDALICTSTAVRDSVETQLSQVRDYLERERGPRRRGELQRATIPLGVNTEDFRTTPEDRKAWREKLDIPEDAVVALYVGRFNVRAKMNPALMALALEKAARRIDKPLYWVNSGHGANAEEEATFHAQTRALCPSVHYRSVDGRPSDVRFSIWSVADLFISFSDNIQETFGLTPIEAMAAGLPCVVTDWNGYKDTVRHGLDGFRVPTLAPPPDNGADLAFAFSNSWMNYDNYVGAVGQFTAIDYEEAAAAITILANNAEFRRKLGENAQRRAREVFDWSVIIPQYQALWGELNARRLAAAPEALSSRNPFRPDPFTLFKAYPTAHSNAAYIASLAPGMDWPMAKAVLESPLATYSSYNRPTLEEAEAIVGWLAEHPAVPAGELVAAVAPARRRAILVRGLLWLARYGVITLTPPRTA
ncbi:glycosyltransferase family 4 protein [Phenylobacterium sp. J367]|uniref:glycosyltransferase family 4 protein n=1 Tax=Phenylobacterium sp. J367 TaxID=2898435 RepID=UPI00215142E0|nr:glycosyltransferase family 4 protein [Phenylobacterium sp. J367]MCR5877533.1 glycosyltransferase family 4 protein [Phenylobacterium sp. J367]